MKVCKKGLALVLSIFMVANAALPVFAAEGSSSKEEVVYINTNADGTVDSVNVVNIFDGGNITDYGQYSSVKMLTATDKIKQSDDKITFSTSADKVYYQGTLKETEIPWNISIRYFLDKKEYTAEEIAGKTGSLEIKIAITQNHNCKGSYFDEYALQTTFMLDTNICDNIKANEATFANVGSDKQLLYTILPGKGLETSIYMDVTDFEMDAVSINGIKLNLNIEIDEEELVDKVEDLMVATKKLDDGAMEIYDGTVYLKSGGNSLNTGISSLNSGVSDLDSGILTLQNGMNSMQTGLNTLNNQSSALSTGSTQIKNGIVSLSDGITSLKNNLGYSQYKAAMSQNGLDIDSLKSNNQQAITACSGQIESLKQMIGTLETQGGYETQIEQLQTQISGLENIINLLSGNNAAIDGTENYLNNVSAGVDDLYTGAATLQNEYEKFDDGLNSYTDGITAIVSGYDQLIDGISSLASGSKELLDGSKKLSSGSSEFYDGIAALCDGAKELNNGTSELNSETSKMNTKVQNQIDEILASIEGKKTETQSFVSEKNTNVDNVQFVIKTPAVEKENSKVEKKEETESKSLWQKFIQLFGL